MLLICQVQGMRFTKFCNAIYLIGSKNGFTVNMYLVSSTIYPWSPEFENYVFTIRLDFGIFELKYVPREFISVNGKR